MAVAASTIPVTAAESLERALSLARPGDTIVLAPGYYGDARLTQAQLPRGGHGVAAPVTITSRDPDDPAVLEGLTLAGVTNLTLDGLTFAHTPQAGDRVNDPVLSIRAAAERGAANIAVVNSRFVGLPADAAAGGDPGDPADVADHGRLVAGMYSGTAISVRDAGDVVVEKSEITGFYRGVSVEGVTDMVIRRNSIHDIRSDGIAVGEVRGIVIENNVIRDLLPWRHEAATARGDHPDMIQFWTTNSDAASTGIVIRDNALVQTRTDDSFFAQGIFMRNPKAERDATGSDFFYRDVAIERNLIYNAHVNSLVVGEAHGVSVRENVLIQNTGSGIKQLTTPIIAVAARATDVAITDNIVPAMARDVRVIAHMATLDEGAALGWQVDRNVYTQVQQGRDGQVAVGPEGAVVDYDALLADLDTTLEQALAGERMGVAQHD